MVKKKLFPFEDHFHLSRLLSLLAFDHLARACRVYVRVHEQRLDDVSMHDCRQCLGHGTLLKTMRAEEVEACAQAVVLFQASMEKIPHFLPSMGPGLKPMQKRKFGPSWSELLKQITAAEDKDKAKAAFSEYEDDMYTKMRNPIAHGREISDMDMVNSINTFKVHAGMKAGWLAYESLLAEVFPLRGTSLSAECNLHGIPESLDITNFPDLGALSDEYFERSLEGAKAASRA